MVKLHNGYFVQEKTASVPKSEIEKEICRLIKNNKGRVDNLSIIHEDLKKTFPSFDVKQYGFSRLSSFIRSFNTFKIKDNVVQMRWSASAPHFYKTTLLLKADNFFF